MAINTKCIVKYEEAYKDLQETIIPFEFLPTSPYYHMEEWREVLPQFVPGVLLHTYWVSNHGRVYSNLRSPKYPNGGIMAHSINQRGYHQINLQSVECKKIGIKISRLVMLHFRFVPNCHLFEVDHLDGNKDNNCLWNFEWVTPQENTHRAIKNSLRTISCSKGYYNSAEDKLLNDTEARTLFYEAKVLKINKHTLMSKYKVSSQYIDNICCGYIRPYIYQEYIANTLKF